MQLRAWWLSLQERTTPAHSPRQAGSSAGDNDYGQLGNNSTIDSSIPVDVTGLSSGVAAISAGQGQTCALTTVGGVKCWGGINGSLIPIDIPGLASGVVSINTSAAYDNHTCVLTTIGGVKCSSGIGTYGATLVDQPGLPSDVTAITVGKRHACSLTSAGGVKCWGLDDPIAEIFDPTGVLSSTPVNVPGLSSGVTAISAGYDSTFALTTAGGVKAWENNGLSIVDIAGLTSGVAAI
ncbi:MAG: chromosome condensation regulator RCC1, partial [Nitrosomonadales bacterium]|nr:chromosome condensation regulator RCC1 [Nitrosomonadales bacterium]